MQLTLVYRYEQEELTRAVIKSLDIKRLLDTTVKPDMYMLAVSTSICITTPFAACFYVAKFAPILFKNCCLQAPDFPIYILKGP